MEKEIKQFTAISKQTLRRLPHYRNLLKTMHESGVDRVSAPIIAKELHLNEVQVRKDLAAVSENGGKPRTGYDASALIRCIETCLGYNNVDEAVLVGAGQLGRALLSYSGFEGCGVKIIAAFDQDANMAGTEIGGRPVFPMERLGELCRRMKVHIGIITVPESSAQNVCDLLVQNGILAIWNFAPVHLSVPEHILVHHENLAASLSLLSRYLREKLKPDMQVGDEEKTL